MYQVYKKWTSAKKSSGHDGFIYDSKFEASYGNELELRKKAGEILGYDRQVTLPLVVNGYQVCTYRIDFIVYHDGVTEYVECKGWPTDVWRLKWKVFEALFTKPGNKLTIVQQGKFRPPKARKVKNL